MLAMLRHNLGLKILALALAILTCIIVKTMARPVGDLPTQRVYTKVIDIVPPESPELIAQVSQKEATVTLKGRRPVLERIDPSLILVQVDLSDRNKPANALEIVDVMAPGGAEVSEVDPSHVWVNIAERKYASVPVRVHFIGNTAKTSVAGVPFAEPQKVRIQGAADSVDKVVAVQVPISVSGAKETFSTAGHTLHPIDVDGHVVKDVEVQASSVYATVPIFPSKAVEIDLSRIKYEKRPGWTYDLQVNPKTISIIDKHNDQPGPQSLSVSAYSFKHSPKIQMHRLPLIVPNDVELASGNEKEVIVTLTPEQTGGG